MFSTATTRSRRAWSSATQKVWGATLDQSVDWNLPFVTCSHILKKLLITSQVRDEERDMSIQELMRAVLKRCLCLGPDGGVRLDPRREAKPGDSSDRLHPNRTETSPDAWNLVKYRSASARVSKLSPVSARSVIGRIRRHPPGRGHLWTLVRMRLTKAPGPDCTSPRWLPGPERPQETDAN
jgi:hypothetical protein